MTTYKRILAAVDLGPGSAQVARQAQDLATALGAHLQLVHVVQPMILTTMPSAQAVSSTVVDVAEIISVARTRLEGLAREVDLPAADCQVVEGNLRNGIVGAAREASADLLIVGNKDRSALGRLLNKPTGDSVSHRAPCDVLEILLAET